MSNESLPPSSNKLPIPKRIRSKRNVLTRAGVQPKPGVLSTSEKSTIATIVAENHGELVPAQIDALAISLRRDVSTVVRQVDDARTKLLKNASKYADIHMQSAELAIASGNPKALDTARKASEWALERISAKDDAGKEHRVIESASVASTQPVIKIGIALGGLPGKRDDSDE